MLTCAIPVTPPHPRVFANDDVCYILAFATIMLNTGLHNPAVKNKQTLESFKRQVSGINDGGDLPDDMLVELFRSIQTNPFKLPEDEDGTLASVFMNPERSGYLTKEGGKTKNWKKRWFTLVNGCLYYFENDTAKTPKGIVPLENLKVEPLPNFTKKNCFELTSNDVGGTVKGAKTNSKGQFVQARHTSYKIAAESQEVITTSPNPTHFFLWVISRTLIGVVPCPALPCPAPRPKHMGGKRITLTSALLIR